MALIKLRIKELYEKINSFITILSNNEVYYIGGAETLPPPLNVEEEMEILKLLDSEKDKAKKILVERNLRLVVYIAKKFENSGVNIEDLISIGSIGLMKAINTFDINKNIKLATYASRCIENEILMYLRRNNKTKNEVSIDEPLNTDGDGNELLLADILGSDEDGIFKNLETEADKKIIEEYIGSLSEREKNIMELRFGFRYGEEKTQKEVADLLGISQSYISRIEKKIIHNMKKEIKW
ncbi:MAG: RNA polymerase sporulation sigma factor SigE [Clostridia bacterium]|nr:RNA polymerase sporulation sigma factor SigE [Clostridia bacterium]